MNTLVAQNRAWAGQIIDRVIEAGVREVFFSSGSRSTPLVLEAAGRAELRLRQHLDERGSGFAALGASLAGEGPAVVITTSGTAVVELLPAVVEASQEAVPLVLLTADRPPEVAGTQANQAIWQPGVFGVYPRAALALACPDDPSFDAEAQRAQLTQTLAALHAPAPGPVHVNVPFREPGEPEPAGQDTSSLKPYAQPVGPAPEPPPVVGVEEAVTLLQGKPLVITVGSLPLAERERVRRLLPAGVPRLVDPLSGLRFSAAQEHVHHAEHLMVNGQLASDEDVAVLHVGGRLVSKRLHAWLGERAPAVHLHLPVKGLPWNASHSVTGRVEDLERLLKALGRATGPSQADDWLNASRRIDEALATLCDRGDTLHEPRVAAYLSKYLPEDAALFMGNSLPIRAMAQFGVADGAGWTPVANRGASGIDGLIATAAGYAMTRDQPTVAFLGDLSALYDLNGLYVARRHEAPLAVLVVNNDGGGIFRHLPIHDDPQFETLFATPHGRTFEHFARGFDLPYQRLETSDELHRWLADFFERPAPCFAEVNVDRETGYAAWIRWQETLAEAAKEG